MGYYSLILLLSSNLLTAVVVSICHYSIYMASLSTTTLSSLKMPRVSPVFQHSPHHPIRDPSSAQHNIQSYFNRSLDPKIAHFVDTQTAIRIVHTNCSLPQKSDNCSFAQFEALLNLADRTVCRCDDPRITVGNRCQQQQHPKTGYLEQPGPSSSSGVTVFAVTPTYTRHTQKVDLTSLCYTIQKVPNLIWIVVEDADHKTSLVTDLLERCKVRNVHLNAKTSSVYKVLRSRGVEQRNTALAWIRDHCKSPNSNPECQNGVLYFMDDDNKYDRRLFEEIKKTQKVSVLPVAFSGGLKFEGPICKGGKVVSWRAHYAPDRTFAMDMAGFAINIATFLSKPAVKMGFKEDKGRKRPVKDGYLETDFLENFATKRESVECRGSEREVLVWHVKTLKPPLPYEAKHSSTSKLEV